MSAPIVAILDFGSQFTQVIARRIRECNVHSKIFHYRTTAAELKAMGVTGVILSGGPASVKAANSPRPDPAVFELGVPVLGICYGMQLMGAMLGGEVAGSDKREYGHGTLTKKRDSKLFSGLPDTLKIWNSHGDKVTGLPTGFVSVASSDNADNAVIENTSRNFYGIQFHPEVHHSERGVEFIKNFLYGVCGLNGEWKMSEYIHEAVEKIRATVGKSHVILGLSGGVDSSVAAALIHRAIGDRLTCVFVDNGLLRKNEREDVEKLFKDTVKMDLRVVDASDQFLGHLAGVNDPEHKRKIIGREFVAVFESEIANIRATDASVEFLAQGTLYPDVIESVSIDGSPAATIKTHHNVGGLPAHMKMKLLEPLRELFKDEVRALGKELGLPADVLWRHPFPGPGLAVRCCGEITRDHLRVLREADAIFIQELKSSGWYSKTWQAFCVFLPVRTVGVMGDERTYDNVIAVRAVDSTDAMTADWSKLPYELLQKVSSRIINEVKGVNRVVYDISSKPPATIEWE